MVLFLAGCPPEDKPGGTAHETADTGTGDDTGTGPTGTTFIGAPNDAAGNAVATSPDLTGDGVPDAVIAAWYGGRVCVFPGPVADGRHLLDEAPSCVEAEDTYDFAGYSVADAGDADGDGTGDLLVGAIGAQANGFNSGKVYVVTGPLAPGATSLVSAHAAWIGEYSGDYLGTAVAAVGDVTGDGIPDLAAGASSNDAGGAGGGKAYVLPGPIGSGVSQAYEVTTTFLGAPLPDSRPAPPHGSYGGGDAVGEAIAGPGDVTGDGVDDLLLGARGEWMYGLNGGKALVWNGPIQPAEHLAADADRIVYGGAPDLYFGSPVAAPGDLTGDGVADMLVSADGDGAGRVFLIPGSPATGGVLAADVAAVTFVGEADTDELGYSVAAAGDLDGDGETDLVFGAPRHDCADADCGAAYMLYGPFTAGEHEVGPGLVLLGEHGADTAGCSVAGAVDLTGDDLPDLLVGATYNDDGGVFSGKAYLIPGE